MPLIGSRIKPAKEHAARIIDLDGRLYEFKDLHGNGQYIADVDAEHHVQILLDNGAFYAYDGEPPTSLLPPPPRIAGKRASAATELDNESFETPVLQEAKALLELTPAKIGSAVGKVTSLAVVRAARVLEQAESAPRAPVVKILGDTLEMAAAAGSKA